MPIKFKSLLRNKLHPNIDQWNEMTERHKSSAIPYMQRLLNERERNKMKILKQVDNFSMPVNNGTLYAPHH